MSDEEVTGKLHTQSVALAENDTAPVRRMLRNGGSRAVYVSGIKRGGLFPADMDCLLTMMALDDETEDVLDCLTAQGDELLISVLTHAGLHSIFPQARWQCAELLGRRSIPDGMALLRQYANDRDAYVAKRARNAMKAITGNKNG